MRRGPRWLAFAGVLGLNVGAQQNTPNLTIVQLAQSGANPAPSTSSTASAPSTPSSTSTDGSSEPPSVSPSPHRRQATGASVTRR
jgi:hypothetical protein